MKTTLKELKKGTLFTMPWSTSELPSDSTFSGSRYIWRRSSSETNEDGTILVFNKDLRSYSRLSGNTTVETLY